jgi:hypothetical protein
LSTGGGIRRETPIPLLRAAARTASTATAC